MAQEIINSIIGVYESQRKSLFASIEHVSPEQLWVIPSEDRWSIGQHLDHLHKTMVFFNKFLGAYIFIARPFAWAVMKLRQLFKKDAIRYEIASIYEEKFMKAPKFLHPTQNPSEFASLGELQDLLERDFEQLTAVFYKISDGVGNSIFLWDGPLGWLNILKEFRTVAHHEAWHFSFIYKLLEEFSVK